MALTNHRTTRPIRVGFVLANAANPASGPAYSVPRLAQALAAISHRACISTLEPRPRQWAFPGVAHHCYSATPLLKRAYVSEDFRKGILSHSSHLDVVHSHGLWLFPNLYPAWAAEKSKCKLVISPRGMLSPGALAFGTVKKNLAWSLWHHRAVSSADCLHATSGMERDELRELGLTNPIAVIANGVDAPPVVPAGKRERKRLLFLSRIHAKKGLDLLLLAWKVLSHQFPDWDLIIAGPDDGALGSAQTLVQRSDLTNVSFVGSVYGNERTSLLSGCDLFVLPSRSENFGLVIAEALAHGLPAVVSNRAPWEGLEQHECGLWVDLSVDSLRLALSKMMSLDTVVLQRMGESGRSWIRSSFEWNAIAAQMADLYRWLLQAGPRPNFVQV